MNIYIIIGDPKNLILFPFQILSSYYAVASSSSLRCSSMLGFVVSQMLKRYHYVNCELEHLTLLTACYVLLNYVTNQTNII